MNKHGRFLAVFALWLLAVVAHAGKVTYIHTDAQGTPVMESDAQGHITARFEYTPYGVAVTSVGAAPDGPGYTGHVNDPETGLVYMQARYYDPMAGRFLSVDPVGVIAGKLEKMNRYSYGSLNPINVIDPDGKDSSWVQSGRHTNIVIPVHFVGSGATTENIKSIILMAKRLDILNQNYTISVVSTDKLVNGQLNTMDLSSGYDYTSYGDAGEGVKARGGNSGHINTSNAQWLRAALHDVLHFASFKDGYVAKGKGNGRVWVGYLSGYDSDDIMAERKGNVISQKEIDDADDWGRRRGSNKICRVVGPQNITQCD